MDKFILIPYEKYQRLQRNMEGSGQHSNPIEPPSKDNFSSVPKPPPGKRDNKIKKRPLQPPAGINKPETVDWISF